MPLLRSGSLYLADPQRQLPSRRWYGKAHPLGSQNSWCEHLCISRSVLDDFVPTVEKALQDHDMLLKSFRGRDSQHQLRRVVRDLASRRPDIACTGRIPLFALTRVIKRIASQINLKEKRRRESMEKRRATAPKGGRGPSRCLLSRRWMRTVQSDSEPDNSGEDEQAGSYRRETLPRDDNIEVRVPRRSSVISSRPIPASQSRSILPSRVRTSAPSSAGAAAVLAVPESFSPAFDPAYASLDVHHPTQCGWVFSVYLTQLLSPLQEHVDLRTCRDVLILRLHAQMSRTEFQRGVKFFRLDTDVLWCTIDGIERIVDDQVSFEIACRRMLEACLRKEPDRTPTISFYWQRRVLPRIVISPGPETVRPATRRSPDSSGESYLMKRCSVSASESRHGMFLGMKTECDKPS